MEIPDEFFRTAKRATANKGCTLCELSRCHTPGRGLMEWKKSSTRSRTARKAILRQQVRTAKSQCQVTTSSF